MGSGIAFSAAQSGYPVILFDAFDQALDKAHNAIRKNISFLLDKGKIIEQDAEQINNRIHFTNNINEVVADLIVEAIVEKTEAKVDLFRTVANNNLSNTIFSSNTSSLSISLIQKEIPNPERVAGLHFFNPAHIMKLVEVVKGNLTSESVMNELVAFSKKLGKTPVVCKDAPGFIVNRVARHFYLESMKVLENNRASVESIDAALENAGFKMGPFKLMDMIGMDVNLAVSQSLYDAFNHTPRFKPSPVQIDKVQKGELGRKTGKGFYQY